MIKQSTFKKLYEEALKDAEKEKRYCDNVEVVLVPIVITKTNGKIGSIGGVNTDILFKSENNITE